MGINNHGKKKQQQFQWEHNQFPRHGQGGEVYLRHIAP